VDLKNIWCGGPNGNGFTGLCRSNPWRLILGESSYQAKSTDVWRPDYRKRQCLEYVAGDWSALLERNITQTMAGCKEADVQRAAIWANFAMTNYISDSLVVRLPGEEKPTTTEAQWASAARRLPPLLNALKPTHVLVLGKTTLIEKVKAGLSLTAAYPYSVGDENLFYYCWKGASGQTILLTSINHPSGSYGYKWQDWHPRVQAFFALPLPDWPSHLIG